MQQISEPRNPSECGDKKPKSCGRVSKSDVIGGAILVIFVAAVVSGYYSYNYIVEDSARMKFWVSFMFSFAALIVIVIQAAIYWQQADFMEQQAKAVDAQLELSRKAIRYSEAAYITINRAEITKRLELGKVTQATVELINSGNTPAYKVRMFMHFGIRPEGFCFTHEEAMDIPGRVSSAVMGAHNGIITQDVQSGTPLNQEVLDLIKEGWIVHVWGLVLYEDVFKRNRWTQFALMLPDLRETLFTIAPTCNDAGGDD